MTDQKQQKVEDTAKRIEGTGFFSKEDAEYFAKMWNQGEQSLIHVRKGVEQERERREESAAKHISPSGSKEK